jgi:hypothetical protein
MHRASSRAGDALPPPPAFEGSEPPLHPSPRSLRGLDWFVFFVADVQTGFGPFVSVYPASARPSPAWPRSRWSA